MIIESKCLRMAAPPIVELLLLLLVLVGRCCLYIYSRKTGIRKHNNQLHGFQGAVARRGSTGRSPRAHFLPPSPTNTSATQTTLSGHFPQNTFPSSRPPNTTAPTVESAFPLFSAPRPTLKLSTTHRQPATLHREPREPAVRQGNPLVSI